MVLRQSLTLTAAGIVLGLPEPLASRNFSAACCLA